MRALLVCALLGAGGLMAVPGGLCTLPDAERTTTPSTACLACHDGSVAPGRDDGHVGAGYLAALRAGHALRPSGPLPPAVLVEGRVECTSCHDGRSGLPHALAAPLTRSAMCTCCHER